MGIERASGKYSNAEEGSAANPKIQQNFRQGLMTIFHDDDAAVNATGYCKTALAVLLLALGCGALAQSGPGKAVLLVQRIDDVLYGVDPISLAPVDRHHVSGVLVRVNANQPSPALGYSHFVADCRLPLHFAILSTATSPLDLTPQGASARARRAAASSALASAVFVKTHMLDASRTTAEFACASAQLPQRAVQIARDLFENGGPADMRLALCDLQPNGATLIREDVKVRFSDSEKVVAVNNQWMGTGTVTDAEISFGSGPVRWRIDRNTAEASLVSSSGKVIFMGSCMAATKP